MPVCVLSANGERLMPTENYGKVRHLLKDGRAVIAKRNPFTMVYKADFVYLRNGKRIVEDAKGKRTEKYLMKRKLMLEKYGIEISEV